MNTRPSDVRMLRRAILSVATSVLFVLLLIVFPRSGFAANLSSATVSTFAGSGSAVEANGTGTAAAFSDPHSIVIDSHGNLFVNDYAGQTIRKITTAGVVTTFAGSGGIATGVDGTGPHATFAYPFAMTIDSHDNIYVADDTANVIRKVTSGAVVTTLSNTIGHGRLFDVALDSHGNVFFASWGNNAVYKRSSTGAVTTFATSSGHVHSITIDSQDNLYFDDYGNSRVMKVTPDGTKTVFAGTGTCGETNGIGTAASLCFPISLRVDHHDNIIVTEDGTNGLLRKITPAGVVTNFLGTGVSGYLDGPIATAQVNMGYGRPAFDAVDNAYFADNGNNRIRKITFTPITGHLYIDENKTPAAAGKSIAVSLNGQPVFASGATIAGGQFTISAGLNMTGGTVVSLYLKGDTNKAVTVTMGSGGTLTGVNLFVGRLTARCDAGSSCSLTNSQLGVAAASGDSAISAIYSVAGGNLTLASGKALRVGSTGTFAPGGNVSTSSGVTIAAGGTLSGGYSVITLSGSFLNQGTLSPGTSNVILNGVNQTLSGSTTFYSLTKAPSSADTLSIGAGTTLTVSNFNVSGISTAHLTLQSTIRGIAWHLLDDNAGPWYLTLSDSANNSHPILTCTSCTDGGGNTRWAFVTPAAVSTSTTTTSGGAGGGGGGGGGGRSSFVPVSSLPITGSPTPALSGVASSAQSSAPNISSSAARSSAPITQTALSTLLRPSNLRMMPSASAKPLATLQKNWQVTIESVNGQWAKVRTMGGREGYVLTANVTASVPLPSPASSSAAASSMPAPAPSGSRITTVALKVHADASMQSQTITQLPKDTTVGLVDVTGAWAKIRLPDGRDGYVIRKYLRK